jgi:hypothetical protein
MHKQNDNGRLPSGDLIRITELDLGPTRAEFKEAAPRRSAFPLNSKYPLLQFLPKKPLFVYTCDLLLSARRSICKIVFRADAPSSAKSKAILSLPSPLSPQQTQRWRDADAQRERKVFFGKCSRKGGICFALVEKVCSCEIKKGE